MTTVRPTALQPRPCPPPRCTYVTRDGEPGVYFFSLDAGSRLAVEAARRVYHLPYPITG